MKFIDYILVLMENVAVYIIMYFFNSGYEYSEIQEGKLKENFKNVIMPVFRYNEFIDDFRMRYDDQCRRRDMVENKTKILITVDMMILGISLLFCLMCSLWWYFIPMILSAGSVMMCLFIERPKAYSVPSNIEIIEKQFGDNYKEAVMSNWQNIVHFNDCVIDLMTGAYCTARRMTGISIMAFVIIAIMIYIL